MDLLTHRKHCPLILYFEITMAYLLRRERGLYPKMFYESINTRTYSLKARTNHKVESSQNAQTEPSLTRSVCIWNCLYDQKEIYLRLG